MYIYKLRHPYQHALEWPETVPEVFNPGEKHIHNEQHSPNADSWVNIS